MRQQRGLVDHVIHLVDRQDHRTLQIAQLVDDHLVIRRPMGAFNHEDHQLDIADGAAGRTVHQAVDRPLLLDVQPRGIHIDSLVGAFRMDAHDAVTGGLRLT